MASSRKKQDENILKILRELAALPQNKFCFDCGQRGPTYVNVTVGSFICTKCSGLLRGITPPHRVKSISIATFTPEEIDTIRSRGNDYCRKVWLGLYEGSLPTFSDEQQVRDFLIEKYERKRYYLEKNNMTKPEVPNTRPWSTPTVNGTAVKRPNLKNGSNNNNLPNGTVLNGTSRSRPEVKNHHQNGVNNNLGNSFAVDFDKADIFSNSSTGTTGSSQSGFADFEHNQVYNANNDSTNGMPTSTTLNAWSKQQAPLNPQNGLNGLVTAPLVTTTPPLVEDKYAALKDLDNEMKQQQQDVWSTSNTGSTGSLYSSSTPNTGSVYGSPSPQGSIFGSPSQGQFISVFNNPSESNPPVANPFGSNSNPWLTNNGLNGLTSTMGGVNGLNGVQAQQGYINPFRDQVSKANGGFPTVFPSNGLNGAWGGNPFKVGAVSSTMNVNNPFL